MLIKVGGDEEDRTLDLTDANRTLSQLSYVPTTELLSKYTTIALKIQGSKRKKSALWRKIESEHNGWSFSQGYCIGVLAGNIEMRG